MQIGAIPIFDALELNAGTTGSGTFFYVGTGSPEGVISAPALKGWFYRQDGAIASNTILYFKNTGAGTTGWVTANFTETDTLQTVASRGSITNTSIFSGNGTVNTVMSYNAASGFGLVGTSTNHDFLLYTNGTEKLRITTGGAVVLNQSGVGLYTGSVSPEGVLAANPGSAFFRTAGGSNTTVYVKTSGTGTTGWLALLNSTPTATTIVATSVSTSQIQTNTYMNTTYASAAIGDKYIFTNLSDAAGSVAEVTKYTSTTWYNSIGYVKNT